MPYRKCAEKVERASDMKLKAEEVKYRRNTASLKPKRAVLVKQAETFRCGRWGTVIRIRFVGCPEPYPDTSGDDS